MSVFAGVLKAVLNFSLDGFIKYNLRNQQVQSYLQYQHDQQNQLGDHGQVNVVKSRSGKTYIINFDTVPFHFKTSAQLGNVCLTNLDIIYSVWNNTSCFMCMYINTMMFHSQINR